MNKKVVQDILVDDSFDGRRLDYFLSEKMDITRSAAQKLIRDELVIHGSEVLSPKTKVVAGDKFTIYALEPIKPDEVAIIHEDNDVIVVNKPSGITTHPAPGEKELTLTEILGSNNKVYAVHRLDKGTSGVIVLAKNEKAATFLKKEFASRKVKKEYLALVKGTMADESGTIDLNLERSEGIRGKIMPSRSGKTAVTDFKVKRRFHDYTLVSAYPRTGRTHQIRTHLAAIGHPIYGDVRYGNDAGRERIFLHAYILELNLPSGTRNAFIAPMPTELEQILENLQD